jgi:hypothetical protein
MLVIAFSTLWFQDPLSAYGGHWFSYNSWAINYGSWVHAVPGWLSNGKPGAMLVEPILIMPGLYVYVFVITMFLGCAVMRRAKAKWPQIGTLGLIGVCFVGMVAFDIILEGVIFMPLGVWEYPGGRGFAIFSGSYHAFPLNEVVTVSATFTAVACLRYFRNDRGQTLVERGAENLRMSGRWRCWPECTWHCSLPITCRTTGSEPTPRNGSATSLTGRISPTDYAGRAPIARVPARVSH